MASAQSLINKQIKLGQQFNHKEALLTRNWQEKMTKSSHQMEVADLIKAGLNPVLSTNSGATSYTGASASNTDTGASALASIYSSQLSAKVQREQMRNQKDIAEISASAQKYVADKNYEATVYNSDTQKWISQNKPGTNFWNLLDKYLGGDSSAWSQLTKRYGITSKMLPGLRKELELRKKKARAFPGTKK